MTIVVDIGNTSSKIYELKNGCVTNSALFDVKTLKKELTGKSAPEIIIASVVPERTDIIADVIKKASGSEPFIIRHEHYKDLKSRYTDITELGIDRLCNVAYAVKNFKKNAVVIDLGSAVTFEIISGRGEFEGGMILPGIRLQFEALAKKTALLPELNEKLNSGVFIGRSTKECIMSGVQNGIAGVCNDFIKEISERLSAKLHIVLSGGDAELISQLVDFDHTVEKHTVPMGAYIISRMNR
jgi:type III pantothenate kinase